MEAALERFSEVKPGGKAGEGSIRSFSPNSTKPSPSASCSTSPAPPPAHLSYLTTGQDVPDNIEAGHPRSLARLILGEKL